VAGTAEQRDVDDALTHRDSVAEPLHISDSSVPIHGPVVCKTRVQTAVGIRTEVNLHLIKFHGKCEHSYELPIA